MTTDLCFIRPEGAEVDQLLVLRLTHDVVWNSQYALYQFERALSSWVEETVDGESAYKESCEDFNVGDFINLNNEEMKSLKPFLTDAGISATKVVFELSNTNSYGYDRVLAQPK